MTGVQTCALPICTDNTDVGKALDHLRNAVDNVQKSVDGGNRPDLTPVKNATAELSKVCTS